MKYLKKLHLQKGTTLLEIVLYIGILTILLSALIPFAWNLVDSGAKSSTNQEIFTQGQYVADRITYEIRNASSINSVSATQISLATANAATNPTTISLNNGVINMQQGVASPIALNSVNTKVTSLNFTNYSDSSTQNVQFTFTIIANFAGAGTRQEYNGTVTMEGTADVRSNGGSSATHPANWYSSSWGFRQAITIDHTKVSSTQTNFPVLISLPSNANLKANAQASGNDILFTDSTGTTKYAHEIEQYDSSTGTLVAWVNIPSLSSTTDTTIDMYYGNASATNQQNANGVWDSNYAGVWHLKEAGNGTSGEYDDSTSNSLNGTGGSGISADAPTQTASKIYNGQNFDGSIDFINVLNNALLQPAKITVEGWIKFTTFGTYQAMMSKADGGGWYLDVDDDVANAIEFGVFTSSSTYAFVTYPSTTLSTGTWYHILGVSDGSNVRLYLNGAQVASAPYVGNINYAGETNDVTFGADAGPAHTPDIGTYFHGGIDEVRISSIGRSAAWITTEYNNESSPATFYSVAGQETY